MKTNTSNTSTLERTHEGAPAARLNTMQALRRSVCACMLFESEFYEDGTAISDRIVALASQIPPEQLAALAVEVRTEMNLRHVPLLLLSVLTKTGKGSALVSEAIKSVISRADEPAELLAIHAKVNGVPTDKVKSVMTHQMRKGLAAALLKFDSYALAKYNRDRAIKIRDVAFLCHVKPDTPAKTQLLADLVNPSFYPEATKSDEFPVREHVREGTPKLAAPDTWEVALSGGADKKDTFTRLLRNTLLPEADREGRGLGYLALLRNLRGMTEAGVDVGLIRDVIVARKGGAEKVLPFRFIAAARACPQLEPALDAALCESVLEMPILDGKTIVLVDVSGSMEATLSGKSDLKRIDAAAALASIIHGDLRMFSFSAGNMRTYGDRWDGKAVLVEVPPRRGMAGVAAIVGSQHHGGTMLGRAVTEANALECDRLIVLTDEQSADAVPAPKARLSYMVNVASNQHGVGYSQKGWTAHLDGFSEAVLRWIMEFERQEFA